MALFSPALFGFIRQEMPCFILFGISITASFNAVRVPQTRKPLAWLLTNALLLFDD